MIVIECEQGTAEWHEERAGVITASNFEECRKRLKSGANKGDFSQKAKEYAFRLAIERISGKLLSEDKFDTFEMRRGRELEEDARLLHEEKLGVLVEQTGIALTDDRRFGASLDGLIGKDGSSEYKCFIGPSSLMPILLENDVSKSTDQVQGQLWITGKKWSDFVLYCPALKAINKELTIIRVERDDNYIEALESDLLEFDRLVIQYQHKLTEN
jgi:hypothetical protein